MVASNPVMKPGPAPTPYQPVEYPGTYFVPPVNVATGQPLSSPGVSHNLVLNPTPQGNPAVKPGTFYNPPQPINNPIYPPPNRNTPPKPVSPFNSTERYFPSPIKPSPVMRHSAGTLDIIHNQPSGYPKSQPTMNIFGKGFKPVQFFDKFHKSNINLFEKPTKNSKTKRNAWDFNIKLF
jgi:hypothetical protein